MTPDTAQDRAFTPGTVQTLIFASGYMDYLNNYEQHDIYGTYEVDVGSSSTDGRPRRRWPHRTRRS